MTSRQILVTVASAPDSAEMAVNDVILGAMARHNSGIAPVFTSDTRKAMGAAITDAEKKFLSFLTLSFTTLT